MTRISSISAMQPLQKAVAKALANRRSVRAEPKDAVFAEATHKVSISETGLPARPIASNPASDLPAQKPVIAAESEMQVSTRSAPKPQDAIAQTLQSRSSPAIPDAERPDRIEPDATPAPTLSDAYQRILQISIEDNNLEERQDVPLPIRGSRRKANEPDERKDEGKPAPKVASNHPPRSLRTWFDPGHDASAPPPPEVPPDAD